jgi:hypothetical protein
MKKIVIIIVIVCVVLIAGAVYFSLTKKTNPESNQGNDQVVGNDKDAHGCISSAGYSWCEAKNKCLRVFEEFCADAVKSLVDKIKESSGVELLPKGEVSFDWNVYDGKTMANKNITLGVLYQVDDIKSVDHNKIENFFTDNYKADIGNAADGGIAGGQRGFQIDYMACLLNFRHNQLKEVLNAPTEVVGDSLKVTLECGYFNPNDVPKILLEQTIREILAAKYKKAISEISVNITKLADSYAAGSISFSNNKQTEGGVFLAVKSNGKWEVVYDGSGSIDCNSIKANYQFPADMLMGFCD